MNKDVMINHEFIMNQIEEATSLVDIPNDLTTSKIQKCLSKYSKYENYNKIPATDFAKISSLLVAGLPVESELIQLELEKICEEYFSEDYYEAQTYLTNKFINSLEVNYTIKEVISALSKKSDLINSVKDNEAHMYFVPSMPKNSGGKFYVSYMSKMEKLNLNKIVSEETGMDDDVIYSELVDALEDIIRYKYDPTFRRIGGLILKKNETIGSVTFFEPRKEDVVETQIADMERTIVNMTLVRDGLSLELSKMQTSLEKIKNKK